MGPMATTGNKERTIRYLLWWCSRDGNGDGSPSEMNLRHHDLSAPRLVSDFGSKRRTGVFTELSVDRSNVPSALLQYTLQCAY